MILPKKKGNDGKMIQFLIGFLIGGMFGFFVCAICAMSGNDSREKTRRTEKTGEENAPGK